MSLFAIALLGWRENWPVIYSGVTELIDLGSYSVYGVALLKVQF